jgi:RNA polymerase sigma-70 factor (ECF subfamily)
MDNARVHKAVETVWRMESARIIAGLMRLVGDVGIAEDLAQDAMLSALERWPSSGIPDNPGAWLMAASRNRAIDHLRRGALHERKHAELGYEIDSETRDFTREVDATLDDPVGDDILRLAFITCHPVLSREARVALTLRLLGGLTTEEIARAFLSPVPTIAQRIVRAKKKLADAAVPFELPPAHELSGRMSDVREVIYLIFNEGYSATLGEDWVRPGLCEDALRLGRVLAGLAPDDGEVHGLVALMELQASRLRARVDASGKPVLLLDQDRSRWDQLLIRRGLAALDLALSRGDGPGPYTLQASIAACHARARVPDETDWVRIASLYEELSALVPSAVIELNRAVAISMAFGPEPALRLVDQLVEEGSLQNYHLLPAVRGDLLMKLGRTAEARRELERARELTRNEREREILEEKLKG